MPKIAKNKCPSESASDCGSKFGAISQCSKSTPCYLFYSNFQSKGCWLPLRSRRVDWIFLVWPRYSLWCDTVLSLARPLIFKGSVFLQKSMFFLLIQICGFFEQKVEFFLKKYAKNWLNKIKESCSIWGSFFRPFFQHKNGRFFSNKCHFFQEFLSEFFLEIWINKKNIVFWRNKIKRRAKDKTQWSQESFAFKFNPLIRFSSPRFFSQHDQQFYDTVWETHWYKVSGLVSQGLLAG